MPKSQDTYRIFAIWFLLLMILSPVAEGIDSPYSAVFQTEFTSAAESYQQKDCDTDDSSADDQHFEKASDYVTATSPSIFSQPVVLTPVSQYLVAFVCVSEKAEGIFVPSSSRHHRTVHTHYISPQAP